MNFGGTLTTIILVSIPSERESALQGLAFYQEREALNTSFHSLRTGKCFARPANEKQNQIHQRRVSIPSERESALQESHRNHADNFF